MHEIYGRAHFENRIRRVPARRGYRLRKSARRDPLALDYGGYWIDRQVGPRWETVAGGEHGIPFDQAVKWVEGMGKR